MPGLGSKARAAPRRPRIACLLLAALLLVCTAGLPSPAPAAEALPTMMGVDWRLIFEGVVNDQGRGNGFSAPGTNGYPRDCLAAAGSCRQGACCSGRCNAWADGLASEDQPWLATVRLRRDCRSAWIRTDSSRTMFPTGWPDSKVKAVVVSAYKAGRSLPARGDLWCGCAGDMTIFGRQTQGVITMAWPSPDQACGCEQVPLHRR